MSSLPPAIFFVNGDITYPAAQVFIGSQPNNPSSYIASASELTTLQTQLFIDNTMTKQEFDARVEADPNYPLIVRLQGLRILVILPTFHDYINRRDADVVMFLKVGMAYVESNRFWHFNEWDDDWDHGHADDHDGYSHYKEHCGEFYDCSYQAYDLQRITVYSLLRAAKSEHNDVFLPFEACTRCGECNYPFYCDKCHTFSGMRTCHGCQCDCMCGCGIIDNQGVPYSPVHLPNCDNEYHNEKFIHRK